ncbi:MAG: phage holin family protein [Chloroflexi bacterium]|nr:phage holin family protein [Chloroflexota bacterium]
MIAFFVRWAILTVAVWVAAQLISGIHLDGWRSTVIVALILGLLNALVKPALFWVSLPLTVLTLGLFLLVLNTGMLALTAWIAGKFDSINFTIDGFWDAFWGAVIISVVSWVLGWFIDPNKVARDLRRPI